MPRQPRVVVNCFLKRAGRSLAVCACVLAAAGLLAPAAAPASGPEPPASFPPSYPLPPDPSLEAIGEEMETEGVESSPAPGRYIVVLEDSVGQPGAVASEQAKREDGQVGHVYRAALKGYSVSGLSRSDAKELREDPRVKYVEPDRKLELNGQTIPTGISRVLATQSPTADIDGKDDARVNVDVAVIDSGIDHSHPDLDVVQRIDCVESSGPCVTASASEWYYHGTHVAGIIGAIDDENGVVGVAPGARLWDVQVFNVNGEGFTSWTLAGINWVTEHATEIEVANMSLGGAGTSLAQEEALEKSLTAGVANVAAAGNQGLNAEARNPARSPHVITVSALADYDGAAGGKATPACSNQGADDTHAIFSNWGGAVDLSAPGVCINSTMPGSKYANKYGTSFATPHVAGAVALLASKSNPGSKADVEGIRDALIDGGSLAWNDTSEDGAPEPVLYLGNEPLQSVEAATGGWSSPSGRKATLFGAVNPRGHEVQYQFEYGSTAEYGATAPASPAALDKSAGYTPVSQEIEGLTPGATYHYRLVALTGTGPVYGADHAFTTSWWSRPPLSGEPSTTGDEWLEDVSCPSSGSCLAVGSYNASVRRIGSYRLAGGSWQFVEMPTPLAGSNPAARGISCTSASTCTAVGNVSVAGAIVPLVERWNGSSWSVQSISPPYIGAPYSVLTDVDCASATECLGVGYYKDGAATWVPYSAIWKGSSWTMLSTPNPADAEQQTLLEGVSCVSASFCMAVGRYRTTAGGERPVAVKWNGSSWSLVTSAKSSGFSYGVSCISSSFCMAVGGWSHSETWDGSKWVQQQTPFPSNDGGYMKDVSCASTSYCATVGSFWKGARTRALTESWNGTAWKTQEAPQESEANHSLLGIDCLAGFGCSAAGGSRGRYWDALLDSRADVVTEGASSVLPGEATVSGSVNPGGSTTSYVFEYGKTTAYGNSAPVPSQSVGAGIEPTEVSQELPELEPETFYHYRLAATSGGTTVYGQNRTVRSGTPPYELQFTFASPGAGNGQVDYPWGLDVDAEGNLWVADHNNDRVEKFNSKGEYVAQFGSTGTGAGQLNEPLDVAVTAAGDLWVTDGGNDRVQKFNAKGEYLGQFGSAGSGNGQFNEPWGIDVASNGDVWVSDAHNYRVQKFNASGAYLLKVTGFQGPRGLEVDAGDHVWVAERSSNRVHELSSSGATLSQFGKAGTGAGEFDEPQGVDVKASGDVLVTDRFNDRVQQFTPGGVFTAQFGAGQIIEPRGIAEAKEGATYVANSWKDRLEKWQQAIPRTVTGAASGVASSGADLTGIVNPRGVATSYRFEYGTTASYGTKVASQSAGSGSADVAVSANVGGLAPSTAYHYRVAASSVEGTIYGEDKTFTTKASIASKLATVPTTEPFNGSASAVSDFAVDWTALGWAAGTLPKGENLTSGWRASSGYPNVNGASYGPILTDTGAGLAAIATMAVNPGNVNRYFSLWLDLATPANPKTGYELRFTYTSTNAYTVTLSKWQSGSKTTLATKSGYSLVNGNAVALVDEGGTVSAWANGGSGFGQVLSAADASFASGTAAVEASGNISRLTAFKFGAVLESVSGMAAALEELALRDAFSANEDPLSGGGAWKALAWCNSTSGHHTGRVASGWGPYDAYATINGAYWSPAPFADTGGGAGAGARLLARPGSASRYFSLWLHMSNPASLRSGYELRFTETAANVYEVSISRWQAGLKTALASKLGYSFPVGSQVTVVDTGSTVAAWTKTGSEYAQLLSASDSSLKAGYTGIEGAGNSTRLGDFRGGALPPF